MTVPLLSLLLLRVALALGFVVSAWYYLAALGSARQFFRQTRGRRFEDAGSALPAVTVLKPLKGLEVDLRENLESFCRQDYASFQLVCGVADPEDPAIAVVQQLQSTFPTVDIDLVIDGRLFGANHKVSNLQNMYAHARHDVIVIADSDIRVQPDYLRRVVAPLRDPTVGLVSCLYKAVCKGGLPTVFESLFINTDFAAMVMVARKVEAPSYAFGATIALRRDTLDAIGGFLALADYLADDYHLGHRVSQRGLRLVLSEVVVETVLDVGSWARLLQHQMRWARTYRTVRPGGYFASVLTHGTLWALLAPACYPGTPAVLAAAALVGLRLLCASAICFRYLRAQSTWRQVLLLPLKDLLVSVLWLTSFMGNSVKWSGNSFTVLRGGKMLQLTQAAPRTRWKQFFLLQQRRSSHQPLSDVSQRSGRRLTPASEPAGCALQTRRKHSPKDALYPH